MQEVSYLKLMNSKDCVAVKCSMSSVCRRPGYLIPSKTMKFTSMAPTFYGMTDTGMGGGVTIYLASNLSYKYIQFPHPDLELITCRSSDALPSFPIASFYCPHKGDKVPKQEMPPVQAPCRMVPLQLILMKTTSWTCFLAASIPLLIHRHTLISPYL